MGFQERIIRPVGEGLKVYKFLMKIKEIKIKNLVD